MLRNQHPRNSVKRSNINHTPLLAAGVFLLTLIGWWSCLKLDFVNWDDVSYLTANADVQNFRWKNLLTEFYAGNYHPLTMISLALEHSVAGLNPLSYHRTNVFLHALNSVLVFLLILKISRQNLLAIGTALFFSLHPLHVESVAWVAERKDLLYTFFWMLSALSWFNFIQKKSLSWAAISLSFFILSCLSKAMAVTLVPFLFLMEYMLKEKWEIRKQVYKIPFVLIALMTGLYAVYAQGEAVKMSLDISFADRLVLVNYGFWFYILRTFIPGPLSAFYPYPDSVPVWMYILPLCTLVAAGLLWKFRNKDRYITGGMLAYVVILLPVSQILPVGQALTADRYSYLSSLGLYLAILALLIQGMEKLPSAKKIYPYIIALVCCILFFLTRERIRVWQNSLTLYEDVLLQFPGYSTGYVNYGNALRDKNEWNKAERAYMMAVYADPKNDLPWNNLGILASFRKQSLRSVYFYQEAAKRKPGFPVNDYNIATAWFNIGRIDKALPAVQKSLAIDPEYPEALHLYGVILQQMKKYPESIEQLNKAFSLKPDNMQILNDLGNSCFFQGNAGEAEKYFRKSIELKPEQNPDAYNNLAYVLFTTGRQSEAIEMYRKAAAQGHTAAQAYLKQIRQ